MLKVKKLFVQYKGTENPSIGDISFELKKGEQLAILGPSGCGKSTVLNVIAGLLLQKDADIRGKIEWDGELTKPIICMVFQNSMLMPWRTIKKNIAFGLEIKKINKDIIDKKVRKILSIVGLEQYANLYPYEISVGMAQRVNFARALVCEPDLLLLDEPFSALDSETKKGIQIEFTKILREKEITSIFVTHNMEEAIYLSDKVMMLSPRPSSVRTIIGNNSGHMREEVAINYLDFCDE